MDSLLDLRVTRVCKVARKPARFINLITKLCMHELVNPQFPRTMLEWAHESPELCKLFFSVIVTFYFC